MSRRLARRAGGFTVIEMLAVTLLTAVVFVAAVTYYLALSRASLAATEATRDERRGTTAVDRIARDLAEATLVRRPDEVDPLAHPWLFLAESRLGFDGADRLKFATRSHVPRATALHESDLVVVSYFLTRADDGPGFDLWRATTPRLPSALDRSFPDPRQNGVHRLLSGVASFSVRMLSEDGEWVSEWDSSTLLRSSDLPISVQVELVLAPEEPDGRQVPPFTRRVSVPLRPLDLEALLEGAAAGEEADEREEDGDCVTVEQCISLNPQAFQTLVSRNPALAPVIESIRGQCFRDHAAILPIQVEGCD